MRVHKRVLMIGLLVPGLLVFLAFGAQWTGSWGGWKGLGNVPHYLNTESDEPGRWQDPPVCWDFADGSVHRWTDNEKTVAREAVKQWNDAKIVTTGQDFPNQLQNTILESTAFRCRNRSIDIVLRWENNASFFKNWGKGSGGKPLDISNVVGYYVPKNLATGLLEVQADPCAELRAARFLDQCSVIFLNVDNPSWFIDPTPNDSNEFDQQTIIVCNGKPTQKQVTVFKAKRGGPADGKQDLFTVILHEFGHALGEIHSGGCDGNLFTPVRAEPGSPDDDGRVMWEGARTSIRNLEDIVVGLNERRFLTEEDLHALQALYCTCRAAPLARTLEVPKDFQAIQAAIDAAQPGDTIAISPGTYTENLTITKSVILQGIDPKTTFIDGSGGAKDQKLTISIQNAQNVTITGFTITKGSTGVQIAENSQATISNNSIEGNAGCGICVYRGSKAVVSGNTIKENGLDGLGIFNSVVDVQGNKFSGNAETGIHVNVEKNAPAPFASIRPQATIVSNEIVETKVSVQPGQNLGLFGDGIFVRNAALVTITKNTISRNSSSAVFVLKSEQITISENTLAETKTDRNGEFGVGIDLVDVHNATIEKNTISRNANLGIGLYSSSVAIISNIITENNQFGIFADDESTVTACSGNTISGHKQDVSDNLKEKCK